MEPANRSPPGGLTAETQAPSVRPYPSMIFTPVFASKAQMRAAGIGAAPQIANSRLDRSLSPVGVSSKAA